MWWPIASASIVKEHPDVSLASVSVQGCPCSPGAAASSCAGLPARRQLGQQRTGRGFANHARGRDIGGRRAQ